MNTKVDLYLLEGCGRCPLGGTPNCKVNNWTKELAFLRKIILDCGLHEEVKWGVPCYTLPIAVSKQPPNLLILAAFKEYCAISFFKGALLQDTNGILSKPSENTQAARLIRFTTLQDIVELEPIIKAYIFEAIEIEKQGTKSDNYQQLFKKNPTSIPEEFQCQLDKNKHLKKAFESLTPGRQRAYLLFFSAPKQTKTREARIEKCLPQIMKGKGLND